MAKDKSDQPKMTPTSRHILTTPPDGVVELPPPDPSSIPEGRTPIPRLGLRATAQRPYEPAGFAATVTHPNWSPTLFCDANSFIARTDPVVWHALLTRPIALVASVLGELSSWLANPPSHNAFVRDIVARMLNGEEGTPFEVVRFDAGNPAIRTFMEYYVNLLGFRKRLFEVLESQFEERHGRKPSAAELESLAKRCVGERGYQRARKGQEGKGAKHPFADEELVVSAFVYAIGECREVVILTRDADVQEQFYKMQWLLDTHYRAMLLADRYAADPAAFRTRPMPKEAETVRDAFGGEEDLLLERTPEMLEEVLPDESHFVNIHCWLLKGEGEHATISDTAFCAECEMGRVFRTKGTTGGLNTDRLDGRNLHVWLSPLPFQPPGRWAAVVRDNRVEVQSARIPMLDIQHAFNTDERVRHVVAAGDDGDEGGPST